MRSFTAWRVLCTAPWWVAACVAPGTVRREVVNGGHDSASEDNGSEDSGVADTGNPAGSPWVEDGESYGAFGDADGIWLLEADGLVAQELGTAAGAGGVDVLDGVIVFTSGTEGWEAHDVDVYAFTVPDAMTVSMQLSWSDFATDLDAGIFADVWNDGTRLDLFSLGDSRCATSDNPERCRTVSDVVLQPGNLYHLAVAGYLGEGAVPYHVELEWSAP